GNAKMIRPGLLLAPVAALLLAPGCKPIAEERPQDIQQAVTLTPFAQCADLEAYVRDTAVREMRMQMDGMKPDHWYWYGGGGLARRGRLVGRAGAAPAGPRAAAPSGPHP